MFLQQGLSAKQANDTEQAGMMLSTAAKFYNTAAGMYPPDDENFPRTFLFEALRTASTIV